MKSLLSDEKRLDEVLRLHLAMEPNQDEQMRNRFRSILNLVDSWEKLSEDERLTLDSIAGSCTFYPRLQTIPLSKIIDSILQQPEARQRLFFAGADYLVAVHAEVPDLVECVPVTRDLKCTRAVTSGEDASKLIPCGKKAPYLSPLGHPSCLEHREQSGGMGNFQTN